MTASRQKLALGASGFGLLLMLGLIGLGDKGLVDLHYLRDELRGLHAANRELVLHNYSLYMEKLRLEKADPALVEHVARKELGFVGPDEIVLIPPASAKTPNGDDLEAGPDP